jgi:O-antigen ligase
LIISSRAVRSKFSPYSSDLLLYPTAVGLGLLAGYSLLMEPRLVKLLLLLPALVFAVTVPPEKLFVGWLFCAPFVQGASAGTASGHVFFKYLFLVPPLILLARMMTEKHRRSRLWVIDALPVLYLGYIVVRVQLLPSSLSGSDASLRSIYSSVGVGIIGYYFAAFARTSARFPQRVAWSLLWGAIIVAVLALVDAATGWNLWNTGEYGEGTTTRRVVSTFTNSGALGAYLGAGVVFGVAVLAWKGPRALRLPAILLIPLSIPALFFTYSRGPVLGAAVVIVLISVVANRARLPSLLVFATVAILVFAVWGQISSTAAYQDRLRVTETVTTREEIQRVTLDLFREKPVFGWGYNTFDKAKLTVPSRDPRFDALSSHSTFLTVLAELGVVGLTLLLLPWIVIGYRAVSAARRGQAETWIVGACVGATAAYALGALTYDTRFFAIVTALPWIALGLARNVLATGEAGTESLDS